MAEKEYFHGFDYLRCIFCIDVVLWHTTHYAIFPNDIVYYIFYYFVGLLAVPVFYQISLYLFVRKIKQLDNSVRLKYLKLRLKDLSIIFFFWLPISYALLYSNFYSYFTDIKRFFYFLIGIGTVLWYISILALLIIITFIFVKLSNYLSKPVYFSLIFSLLICSFVLLQFGKFIFDSLGFPLWHINPFNFLPYVFTSIIFSQTNKIKGYKLEYLFIVFFIIATTIETIAYVQNWFIFNYFYRDMVLNNYNRISLVLLSSILLLFAFRIKKEPHIFIVFISQISLGIYIIHLIVIKYLDIFISGFDIQIYPLLRASIVLLISIVIVSMIKYKSKKIL